MITTEFVIGAYALSYLINDDRDTMQDREVAAFDEWVQELCESLGHGHIQIIGDGEEFTRCEVTGLWGDCERVLWVVL